MTHHRRYFTGCLFACLVAIGNLSQAYIVDQHMPTQIGKATLMDTTQNHQKYHALHRTFAVGSIIKVMNIHNQKQAIVKVVGKLPDKVAKSVIIQLTKRAFAQLGTKEEALVEVLEEFPQTILTTHIVKYQVKSADNLWKIAQTHRVKVEDIKTWNNLANTDDLKTGKVLNIYTKHLPKVEKAADAISPKINSTDIVDSVSVSNDVFDLIRPPRNLLYKSTPRGGYPSKVIKDKGDKIVVTEKGMASMMVKRPNKYQALHRSAPSGTFVRVINSNNGKIVIVSVEGRLPKGTSSKVIIQLSKRAYDQIKAKGSVPVEIDYDLEKN